MLSYEFHKTLYNHFNLSVIVIDLVVSQLQLHKIFPATLSFPRTVIKKRIPSYSQVLQKTLTLNITLNLRVGLPETLVT